MVSVVGRSLGGVTLGGATGATAAGNGCVPVEAVTGRGVAFVDTLAVCVTRGAVASDEVIIEPVFTAGA